MILGVQTQLSIQIDAEICCFYEKIWYIMSVRYTFTTTINKEGKWYVARCVELGVVSQGKTIVEAKKNIAEAVELFLENETAPELPSAVPLITTFEVNYA